MRDIGLALSHIAGSSLVTYTKQILSVADGFSFSALSKRPKAICAISASLSHISPVRLWLLIRNGAFPLTTVSRFRQFLHSALCLSRKPIVLWLTADLLIQPYTYDTPPPWGVIVVMITPNKVFVKNFSRLQMQAAGAYAVSVQPFSYYLS